MTQGKDNLFSLIIPLVERLSIAYIEYITKRSMMNKLWETFKQYTATLGLLLLISLIFAGSSWLALMGISITYLQTLNLSITLVLLIVLATNLILLFVSLIIIFKLKKKIVSINP
jgi:hypothetical protein